LSDKTPARSARIAAWAVLALAGWAGADLYLRVDLPLAARITNAGFRALVGGLAWLGADDQWRLYVALALVIGLAVLGLLWPALRPWLRGASGALLGLALLTVIAIAALLERALAGGLVVTLVISARHPGGLAPGPAGFSGSERGRRIARAVITAAGLASAYYLFALVLSRPEGYSILAAASALARHLDLSLAAVYFADVLGLTLLLGFLSYRLGVRPGRRDGLALLAGGLAAVVLAWFLEGRRAALFGGFGLLDGAGVLLVLLCSSQLFWLCRSALPPPPARLSAPATWPAQLIAPLLVAGLLFGHCYAARILACPDFRSAPELSPVAEIPEVFRVELNRSASAALLSVRPRRSLASVVLQPQLGELQWLGGPASEADAELADVPEDLAYAPERGTFFAMHSARDPSTFEGIETAAPIRSILSEISADSLSRVARTPFPDLCWASCIEWSTTRQKLYIGCEIPRGLHRWDPSSGVMETAAQGRRLGDVESIALDPEPARDRLFTASLWRSPMLTEMRASDLTIQRQKWLGGANYVVAYDPAADRLFVSSFYGSRVRILDGTSLEQVGLIRTGFGARAIAIDSSRGLVLVSSVYDGILRVAETTTGRVLHRLRVGGHVKDIAIDPASGFAYFWSQCALMRLDLESLSSAEGSSDEGPA
jgi:hypothetical protein